MYLFQLEFLLHQITGRSGLKTTHTVSHLILSPNTARTKWTHQNVMDVKVSEEALSKECVAICPSLW